MWLIYTQPLTVLGAACDTFIIVSTVHVGPASRVEKHILARLPLPRRPPFCPCVS